MSAKQNDFKVMLQALAENAQREFSEHPTPEQLGLYHDGKLPPEDEKLLQEHLVVCKDCTGLMLDLAAFSQLDQAPGRRLSDAEIEEAWQQVRRRLPTHERLDTPPPARQRQPNPLFRSARLPYALAASLLIVSFALGAWIVSLRRENQQLATHLSQRRGAEEQAIKSLDEARRQHESEIAALRRSLDELSQPQLNVPIADLYPRGFARNQGQAAATIDVPAGANLFTLVLNTAHDQTFSTFSLEIVDERGALVWQGQGLQKSALNNFTVSLARRLFPAGQYQMKLYGWRGERKQLVEEYAVRILYRSER